jgi:hypothetical protein
MGIAETEQISSEVRGVCDQPSGTRRERLALQSRQKVMNDNGMELLLVPCRPALGQSPGPNVSGR